MEPTTSVRRKKFESKMFDIKLIGSIGRMAVGGSLDENSIEQYDEETRRALKLFVVLARASASVGEHARQDILRHDLSVSEFGVLELLWHKGPQPLGDIAERILLTTGSVTYVIDQLQKKGLVERRHCPTDRRVIFANLTSSGRERIASLFPDHARRIVEAVSGLSAEEQHAAIALLKKLGRSAADGLPK